MPRLPMQWNDSVAQASLAPPTSVPERYAELWWYSGNSAATSTAYTSANGSALMVKGSTSAAAGTTSTASAKLYTLNSNWPATTKFAIEASLQSANTTSVCLWDITANAAVSGSTISTTSSTMTVVRSGQFTLTPGHVYGISAWSTNGATSGCYVTDASLIIFS